MREKWCKLITLVIVVGLGTFGVAGGAAAEVTLSEVLSAPTSDWDGDGTVDSKLDEWIEITNPGTAAVDLTDLYFRDGTGTAFHYGFSGTLEAGATLLVTGSESLAWQTANDAGSSGLSLNNSGDTLELWRAPEGGSETLVQQIQVPGHAADAERAYARTQSDGRWILHDGLNPYSGSLVPTGTGCDPSPGAANLCESSVPVAGASVGRMKAIW
jgi:hypothetical protein